MNQSDFLKAFRLEEETGRLFWIEPPKNHAEKMGQEAGYVCVGTGKNKSYWQVRLAGKTYKRARVVFAMVHGHWPEPCVDHVNGNSLDDRPSNLREADHAQNAWSMGARRNKASGLPRGVTNYHGQFRAQIMVRGRRTIIGQYVTVAEAKAACLAKRQEAFGDYAGH